MNVIYAGPFDTKGVYKGGISVVVNDAYDEYLKHREEFGQYINLIPFNVCIIPRKKECQGKFNLANLKNSFLIFKNLLSEIKKNNAECVYYNSSNGIPLLKDLLILKLIKQISGIKVIIHIHFAGSDSLFSENKSVKNLTVRLLKKMDKIVFLSESTRKAIVSLGIEAEKTDLIYNFHKVTFDQSDINKKLQSIEKKDVLELIFLGSICERKGILDLLEAVSQLTIPYKLHICGEVTDRNLCNIYYDKIKNIKNGEILEHGYVSGDEKTELLRRSSVLILPSYGEGFPIVLLEGIASGCAVIATDVGAVGEVFGSENGAVILPGDIVKIRESIEKLNDAELLKTICVNNFELSKNYTVDKFLYRTMECIKNK